MISPAPPRVSWGGEAGKAASVGEIPTEAVGVSRKHVNEVCNDRRSVRAPSALILARVFGSSPDFWLNPQRRADLRHALHDPRERERIERARPSAAA